MALVPLANQISSRKMASFFFRLALSVALVGYFVSSIDFKEALRPIAIEGWVYLAMTAIFANLDRIVMGYKWNLLLRAKGVMIELKEAVLSYYVGTFWGTFLPSGIGGDLVRAYRVITRNGHSEEVISSIVVERLLGMGATFLLALVGVGCFGIIFTGVSWPLLAGVVMMCGICVGVIVVSFSQKWEKWVIANRLLEKNRWTVQVAKVWKAYLVFREHPSSLVRFFLLSLGEQGFPVISALLVARALDLQLPAWSVFVLVPVIFALSRVPITVNGFGVREGLYVYFFSYVGLSGSEAFLLGLLTHLVVILSILPGFFYASFYVPSPLIVRSQMPS